MVVVIILHVASISLCEISFAADLSRANDDFFGTAECCSFCAEELILVTGNPVNPLIAS